MRRRILLLVIATTVLVVLAFVVPIAILIHRSVGQSAGNAASTQARVIAAQLRGRSPSRATIAAYVRSQTQSSGRPVSVTLPNGNTVGSTPGDPSQPRSPDGPQPGGPFGGGDPSTELIDVPGGQLAVAFAPARDGGGYAIHVYLSESARYAGTTGWYLLLAGGSLALLLVAVAAGEVLTRRITRPLISTAETAGRLAVGDVEARAPTNGPREVADVGIALNRLADRIDQLIADERETIADLSHRLRTPLTALRLDAESLRDPRDAERVGEHVSTVERTLTAVIRAARRPQREGRMPSADATAVVGDRVGFWSALTEEQGRVMRVDLPHGPLLVRTAAEDLSAAVDALLENVVAHTPEGTSCAVRLAPTPVGARLEIDDAGPGIPESADVRGRSDRGSSGLGLDIARRCAESSGGTMTITRSPAGGARVTLDLGGA